MKRKRSKVPFARLYEREEWFRRIFDKIENPEVREYNLSPKVGQTLELCGMGSGIPGEIYLEIRDMILRLDNESEYDDGYDYSDVVYADVLPGLGNKNHIYLRDKNKILIKVIDFED